MIGAQNTRGQMCLVAIVQWAPGNSVSEEIPVIFTIVVVMIITTMIKNNDNNNNNNKNKDCNVI